MLAIALMSLPCINKMLEEVFAILGDVDSASVIGDKVAIDQITEPFLNCSVFV